MRIQTAKQYNELLKVVGFSYLGHFSQSAKMVLNEKVGNVITYSLYLAPWTSAGTINGRQINTCPGGEYCHHFCLNGSGRAKIESLTYGEGNSSILNARIRKTRLFYSDRELFMALLCYELEKTREYARKRNMKFSVRLNCTSDISPLAFKMDGQNILEMYPDVVFYDYTKVSGRLGLPAMYPNYYLTLSFDGYNWSTCVEALKQGINVAVVFESKEIPATYKGYGVIDMTKSDLRYLDPHSMDCGFIGYLEYHRTANDYVNGHYISPNTPFVVKENDPHLMYAFKED